MEYNKVEEQKNPRRGREVFQKYKGILNLTSAFFRLFPRKIRLALYIGIRNLNGKLGLALRYTLLQTLAQKVGDNVSIHPGVWLFHIENLSIGNNVSIHPMCYIEASGEIKIGNDVSIAHSVTLMSETHIFKDSSISIKDQGTEKRKIIIEDNVWIGAKSTILGGNQIATGSIIGANSVVTKPVPSFSIMAGCPAKEIKKRI